MGFGQLFSSTRSCIPLAFRARNFAFIGSRSQRVTEEEVEPGSERLAALLLDVYEADGGRELKRALVALRAKREQERALEDAFLLYGGRAAAPCHEGGCARHVGEEGAANNGPGFVSWAPARNFLPTPAAENPPVITLHPCAGHEFCE